MTVWVTGLSPEADPGNTIVKIADVPHFPHAVDSLSGQVNVLLRPVIKAGAHDVLICHRGGVSTTKPVIVRGEAPPIKGLEPL